MAIKYQERFEPPSSLPPERPEDIKIEFVPGEPLPKQKGIGRMNDQEQVLLKENLARLLERGPSTSNFGSRIFIHQKSRWNTQTMCGLS